MEFNEFGTLLSVTGPEGRIFNHVIEWTTDLQIPTAEIWNLGLNFEDSE